MKKSDIAKILIVFALVFLANYWGFVSAFKRERDNRRILNIGDLETGLKRYYSEFGYYPASDGEGRIVACRGPYTNFEKTAEGVVVAKPGFDKAKLINLVPCQWGKDALLDAMDVNYPAYINTIPEDPRSAKGFSYKYISDGVSFRILASLELKESDNYSKKIKKEKIKCGVKYCNFERHAGL